MKGVSPKETYEYICKEDRNLPENEQTIFTLAFLDCEQEAHLDDKLGCVTDDGYQVSLGSTGLIALHYGLKNIKNLMIDNEEVKLERDETKKYLPGKIRPWKLSSLSKIPKPARLELIEVIRNGGELKEDEIKN